MKKLKSVLIVLFALSLSLFLFACKPNEPDPGPDEGDPSIDGDPGNYEGYTIQSISASSITGYSDVTDSADQAEIDEMLSGISFTARTDEGNVTITYAECRVTGEITPHVIGDYTLRLTPIDHNRDEVSTTVTISVTHDWHDNGDGSKTCEYDGARLETKQENVVIHYGNFHEGTNATLPSGNTWNESVVYTNYNTDSNLSLFGTAQGANGSVEVPTVTVGQLEKGMTITVRGTAMTTTGELGPWNKDNEYWNSPSIGVADRTLNVGNPAHPGYVGGTSVIVRQEGWVLYNGIGNTRMLASLMGGAYETTDTLRNYGSHSSETATPSPVAGSSSYTPGQMPAANSDAWQNWWVYSSGQGMNSGDYYQSEEEIEYSWYYREDGIIEMTYTNFSQDTQLKAYVKVPDSANGYYDTILHGDYCDITVTESEIITLRTPADNGFKYNGIRAGANTAYAENDVFDATTIAATMEYTQNPGVDEVLQISNSQVYAYRGEGTPEINTDLTGWVSLADTRLSALDTYYKIQFTRGGKTFVADLKVNGSLPFTVTPNRVESALGADVVIDDVLFANNNKVGAFSLSLEGSVIVLTLDAAGYVQKLTDAQKALFDNLGNVDRYVALRINAADLETKAQFSENITTDVPYLVQIVDGDVYLVLALTESNTTVTLKGLQETDVRLELANLSGYSAESEVVKSTWKLNEGGRVEITYTVPASTDASALSIQLPNNASIDPVSAWIGAMDYSEGYEVGGGIYLYDITYSAGVLKVVLAYPAANLNNYGAQYATLAINGRAEVTDYFDYDMELAEANGYVELGNGYYAQRSNATTLTVVKAWKLTDLKDGAISDTLKLNINNGDYEQFLANGLLTVEYAVVNGAVVLSGANNVTASLTLVGTYGDSRDTDIGAYIVFSIDVSALGISGEYYVSYAGDIFDAEHAPTEIIKVASTGVTRIYLDETDYTTELVMTAEGTCYVEGLYAWAVLDGDTVIFYADSAAAGGDHVWEGNTCKLCGATKETASLPAWGNTKQYTLTDGDIYEIQGTYVEYGLQYQYGNFGLVVSILDGADRYWLRTDGYFVGFPGGAWWTANDQTPYNEENNPEGNRKMGSTLPFNTLNGVLTLDGTALDTVSEPSFAGYLAGKTYRVIISYVGSTITVDYNIYNEDGSLSLNYQVYLYEVSGNRTLQFTSEPTANTVTNPTYTHAKRANSVIDTVEAADVYGHAASDKADFTHVGIQGSYDVIAVTGSATKLAENGNTHYLAFKVSLKTALADTAVVKLLADGKEVAGAYCVLAENHESIEVYLPLNQANMFENVVIDITNYEASTVQADILVDLTNLAVSEVSSTVAGADELTIAEGTFTITYEGDVTADDSIVVGETSKKLSELAGNTPVALEQGLSATATVSNGTAVVTFTKAAADLTKVIAAVEVRLQRGTALLTRDIIAPAVAVDNGEEIEDSGWLVKASGTTLTLYTNATNDPSTLPLNVNAGKTTDAANIGIYELAFSVSGNAVNFNETNLLTKAATAVYSENGSVYLVAITLDLTVLNVAADTSYGYALSNNAYYTVSADRAIAEVTPVVSGEPETIREGTCVEDGLTGYLTADESYYYNLGVIAGTGHEWEAKADATEEELHGYDTISVCKNCGAVTYEQTNLTESWGSGTAGNYATWTSFGWEYFGIIHKGGYYEITGLNLSNENNVWELNEPGISDTKDGNADGFRIDNYLQNDNTNINLAYSYTFWNNLTNSAANNAASITQYLDGATVTYVFDYTDVNKLVLVTTVVNGEDVNLTVTVTLTGDLLDTYYLMFHVDGNIYTASTVKTVVPAEKEVPAALTKHVHSFDPDTDRCPDDGVLNPAHEHSYSAGYCVCGAIDPAHTHSYVSGVCAICGHTEGGAVSYVYGDKTYTGTLVDQEIENLDADLTWWNGNTTTFAVAEGDFMIVFNWTQLVNDPQWIEDAVIELFDATPAYFDAAFGNSAGGWGDLFLAATRTETITKNGVEVAEKPAGADVTGWYTARLVRIGDTLIVEQTIVNVYDHSVWTITDTYAGFTTSALTAGIVGNPYACENLVAYYTALTEQA